MNTMPPYRTAVVTGGSSGVGLGIVHGLLELGLHVHVIAVPDAALDALHDVAGVTAHALDVRDTVRLREVLGSIDCDVLVSNAGVIAALVPTQVVDASQVDRLIDVNLRAAIHACHAVLPGMIERGLGHIVFTGSIGATRPTANTAVYSATKAALHAYADGLRLDVHGTGIRVTVIAPGRVQTNLYEEHFGTADAANAAMYATIDAIRPAELGQIVATAISLPAHIDVTRLEVVPTDQVYGGAVTGRG